MSAIDKYLNNTSNHNADLVNTPLSDKQQAIINYINSKKDKKQELEQRRNNVEPETWDELYNSVKVARKKILDKGINIYNKLVQVLSSRNNSIENMNPADKLQYKTQLQTLKVKFIQQFEKYKRFTDLMNWYRARNAGVGGKAIHTQPDSAAIYALKANNLDFDTTEEFDNLVNKLKEKQY